MRKKTLKSAAMVVTTGMLFHTLGCLNFGGLAKWAGPILYDGALDIAWEYIWDQDAVFDLFEDGTVVAPA